MQDAIENPVSITDIIEPLKKETTVEPQAAVPSPKEKMLNERRERLMPCNLFPPIIKVRVFLHAGTSNWIAIRSLCLALNMDSKYNFLVLLMRNDKANHVIHDGLRYQYTDDYDVSIDKPDIAVLQMTHVIYQNYNEKLLSDIYASSKVVIVIPFVLMRRADTVEMHVTELLTGPKEPDAYVLDKLLYSEIQEKGLLKPNIVHIGNPKFDAIYDAIQKREELPQEWKKIDGKKIFLLTTDHRPLAGNITFDLYASCFFAYFNKNYKDCALIIRPHPAYVSELFSDGLWTQEDYESVKKYCDDSDNIIWDERTDYSLSYSLADCVFTDVNCGIILSALTIDKPICVLRRFVGKTCKIIHPQVINHHNVVNSTEELIEFLDRIRAGEDPKAEMRKDAFTKFISHYDGKNGQRIKDFIEKKYTEKFGML